MGCTVYPLPVSVALAFQEFMKKNGVLILQSQDAVVQIQEIVMPRATNLQPSQGTKAMAVPRQYAVKKTSSREVRHRAMLKLGD
jgi:hypothetical protein